MLKKNTVFGMKTQSQCLEGLVQKETSHQNSLSSTETPFQEFQESVSDVWDVKFHDFNKVCVDKSPKQDFFSVHSTDNKSKKSFSSKSIGERIVNFEKKLSKESIFVDCVGKSDNRSEQLSKTSGKDEKNNIPMCTKTNKFKRLLESSLLNLDDLRQLSWSGIPENVRPTVWKLLAGYLPTSLERRHLTLDRKRIEYGNLVKHYFDSIRDDSQEETFRQIHIDIPRMTPLLVLFNQEVVREIFERILFIWAVRHPASGYVQGMNDLVTPFFVVFLLEYLPANSAFDSVEIEQLSKEHLDVVEADTFWCFSKFLDGIQDNYIFAQLGIQHKVNQLKELVQRIDKELHQHLEKNEIDYLQFAFRWINNLLMREIPLKCCIYLWDTYLAELNSFATFQLYVSAAFLLHWRCKLLLEKDFQGLIMLLQKLPTKNWSDSDVSMLVAEAYRLKFTFADAPSHLLSNKN